MEYSLLVNWPFNFSSASPLYLVTNMLHMLSDQQLYHWALSGCNLPLYLSLILSLFSHKITHRHLLAATLSDSFAFSLTFSSFHVFLLFWNNPSLDWAFFFSTAPFPPAAACSYPRLLVICQGLRSEMRSHWLSSSCRRITGWRYWRGGGGREANVPKRRTTVPRVS